MENTKARIFDEKQWKVEAEAVIHDVKKHVKYIELSTKLQSTGQFVYINLTTLEELEFCVELSTLGFIIVDKKHDSISNKGDEYFETPYSLLEFISPRYTQSFGTLLIEKLSKLGGE